MYENPYHAGMDDHDNRGLSLLGLGGNKKRSDQVASSILEHVSNMETVLPAWRSSRASDC